MEARWGSAEGTEASRSVRCRDWGEGVDSESERWGHCSERSMRQGLGSPDGEQEVLRLQGRWVIFCFFLFNSYLFGCVGLRHATLSCGMWAIIP